jgi:hypothetical protein
MDRSAVKAIVERELNPLARRLGVSHWELTVKFDLRDGDGGRGTQGRCTKYVDYDKAIISLDPDSLADEAEVVRVLIHELLHIVLAPFDVLVNAVGPVLKRDETLAAVLDSVRMNAVEQAVVNLERMYRNLTAPPPGTPAPARVID